MLQKSLPCGGCRDFSVPNCEKDLLPNRLPPVSVQPSKVHTILMAKSRARHVLDLSIFICWNKSTQHINRFFINNIIENVGCCCIFFYYFFFFYFILCQIVRGLGARSEIGFQAKRENDVQDCGYKCCANICVSSIKKCVCVCVAS